MDQKYARKYKDKFGQEVGADAYWIYFIKISGMFSLKNKSCWRDREPLVTVSLDRALFSPQKESYKLLRFTKIIFMSREGFRHFTTGLFIRSILECERPFLSVFY